MLHKTQELVKFLTSLIGKTRIERKTCLASHCKQLNSKLQIDCETVPPQLKLTQPTKEEIPTRETASTIGQTFQVH